MSTARQHPRKCPFPSSAKSLCSCQSPKFLRVTDSKSPLGYGTARVMESWSGQDECSQVWRKEKPKRLCLRNLQVDGKVVRPGMMQPGNRVTVRRELENSDRSVDRHLWLVESH